MNYLGRSILAAAVVWIAFASAGYSAERATSQDIAWFKAITQKLRDGIATGDRSLWNQILAPDFVMTTEDGEVLDKQQLLADLTPLPSGFSGVEKVRGLSVRQWGDAAVVHFWLHEQENAYGQRLKTTYVETDTFQRLAGSWKMVAAQVTVVPRNLKPVRVDTRDWPALEGKYGLSGRASWPYFVFSRNAALYGGRDRKSATELIPLSPLVYYQKGSIHIMVFVRDAHGAVNEVLELHKYNEVVLDRIAKDVPR